MDKSDTTFETLIFENQHLIHKICHMYEQTEDDRTDLFQEITIQLWKSYPTFEHKSKFSTWLYRVALNTALTQKRNEKRKPSTNSLSDQEMYIPNSESSDSKDEELQALRLAITKLNAIDRAIIFLYLEEKSYQEIADIIGITPKNVGVKLVRIKAKLLNLLTSGNGK